MAGQALCNVSK